MEQNKPLVVCSGLTKSYGSFTALKNLDLNLERGRFIGLLGPNGSGKTTTIKLLNGLLQPTSGMITVDGAQPGRYTHSIVSYLPDRAYLSDWMKITDVIDFFSDFYRDFDRVKATEMFKTLRISPLDRLKTLSKGTKEKVQLILTMSRRAQLYVLDEPIAGVDPAARDYILNTILANYSEDASVLLSTHLIADIERVLDEVVFLKDGEMVLHESVDTIREEHGKSVDMLFREVFAKVTEIRVEGVRARLSAALRRDHSRRAHQPPAVFGSCSGAAVRHSGGYHEHALCRDLRGGICRDSCHPRAAVLQEPARRRGLSDVHPAGFGHAAHFQQGDHCRCDVLSELPCSVSEHSPVIARHKSCDIFFL